MGDAAGGSHLVRCVVLVAGGGDVAALGYFFGEAVAGRVVGVQNSDFHIVEVFGGTIRYLSVIKMADEEIKQVGLFNITHLPVSPFNMLFLKVIYILAFHLIGFHLLQQAKRN